MSGIGTLGERTLHAALKWYYEPTGDFHEVKVGRFVADIMRDGHITEIQTQGFDRLRRKLEVFLPDYIVTVVCPIAHIKHIQWLDESTGELLRTSKSPKKWSVYTVFPELYKIKMFLRDPNLRLRIVLLEVTEQRYVNRKNRKGYSRLDTSPKAVSGEMAIDSLSDYIKLIPPTLEDEFTTADYATAAKIPRTAAQTALAVLYHVGAVARVGKSGNSFVYRICGNE